MFESSETPSIGYNNTSVKSEYRQRTYEPGIVFRTRSEEKFEATETCSLLAFNMRDKISKCHNAFRDRSVIVDILAILFGIAAWIGVNSVFLQLPILVKSAPEEWSLASYLVVMVQIGNIGPIAYTLIQKFKRTKVKDANFIYVVLAIGTISSLLTAFLYDKTSWIGDNEYSVALFVLVFFTSLNCCTSSVLFMPYMGRFKEMYLISYLIGEGLSGMLPSIVALIQGVNGKPEKIYNETSSVPTYECYTPPPNFNSMAFFLFVFVVLVCSCVAFTLLDKLPLCKNEYAAVKVTNGNSYVYETDDNNLNKNEEIFKKLSPKEYKLLLLLIGIITMLSNGMFQSIQPYSCLPYSNEAYHLTTTLSAIANPVACFLAVFLPHKSMRSIGIFSVIGAVLTIYVFVIAALSPNPPMANSTVGGVLIIIIWTLLIGLVSYVKLCITTIMRYQGGKSLVWTGAISQIGSALGSILIFILINIAHVFNSYETTC